MNPKDHIIDSELEPIRKAYDGLESVDPPAMLDQAVLNAARREVETAPAGRRPVRRSLQWMGAFATAATAVLALTIVIQQAPERSLPTQTNGIRMDSPAAKPVMDEVISPKMEAGARKGDQLPTQDSILMPKETRFRAAEESEPAAASRPADDRDEVKRQQIEKIRVESEVFTDEIDSASSADLYTRPAAPVEAPAREVAVGAAVEEDLPDAEQWLERILLLKRSGQTGQFEQELTAFRQAYPDYSLPAELQD